MPNRVPSPTNDIGKIEIPLPANKFGSFIANLLGKPQTIRNTFFGSFAISHEDISNFFHLVDQRVKEQNRSHLVQFTIRIIYDDGSSYELPNLQDFEKNTEIRPIIATGVTLTWTYLIFFSEKTVPEKQQIEVNIRIRNGDFASSGIIFDALFVRIGSRFPESPFRSSGIINFSISHTMRSWGADIENLLTSHIKSIMKSESRSIPKILNKYSEKMGTISFIICLGALMLLGYQFSENI